MNNKKKHFTWISIFGKVEPLQTGFRYTPSKEIAEGPPTSEFAIAKTDIEFANGEVSFSANLQSKNQRCQLILNHGYPAEIFVGLNIGGAAFGIAVFRSGKWEFIATAGASDSIPLKKELRVKVEVNGSMIRLFIDGVEVVKGSVNVVASQLAMFVDGDKSLDVIHFAAHPQKPKAFVVMQFTEEFNHLYGQVVKPTCEEFGLECIRADDIYANGLIIDDITRSIREASIIVADITPNNLNVFYEVGYAHGMSKETILLSDKKREKLPFDVSGFRTIFYDNSIGGKVEVEDRLRKHLSSILDH